MKIKNITFYLMRIIARVVSYLLFALIFLLIISYILPMFDNYEDYRYIVYLLNMSSVITSTVKNNFPTIIGKIDFTVWIIIVSALILYIIIDRKIIIPLEAKLRVLRATAKIKHRKDQSPSRSDSRKNYLTALKKKFMYRKSRVKKLQRKIYLARKKLYEMCKELSFLSIDVANSTEMKNGQDSAVVDHYFGKYREFVEEKLKKNKVMKSTWTPDGVMCCFESFSDAFNAAREIIKKLPAFNYKLKLFKNAFKVRCGINSGFLYFDDVLPMEEMSDRAIDVAAHLQKSAPPNTLYTTKFSIRPEGLYSSFEPLGRKIDGHEIFEYKPRQKKRPKE